MKLQMIGERKRFGVIRGKETDFVILHQKSWMVDNGLFMPEDLGKVNSDEVIIDGHVFPPETLLVISVIGDHTRLIECCIEGKCEDGIIRRVGHNRVYQIGNGWYYVQNAVGETAYPVMEMSQAIS